MKNLKFVLLYSIVFFSKHAVAFAWPLFIPNYSMLSEQEPTAKIKWMSIEDAVAQQKLDGVNAKKVFIDVYTDWCGWCKRFDQTTFIDPMVVELLNTHFYPVKFNGEFKEDIVLFGNTFKFVKQGNRGYHELAAALLDNKLSYPSIVYFNEKFERILIAPGYEDAKAFLISLRFIVGNHFLKTTYDDYKKKETKP